MTTDIHDLAAGYALDALEGDELRSFEAHLATCAECQNDVQSHSQTAQILGSSIEVEPPASLKANLLRQVADIEQEPVEHLAEVVDIRSRRRAKVLVAVAASLILIASFVGISSLSDSSQTQYASILEVSDAQVATLSGEGDAQFTVVWSSSTGEFAVQGNGVPPISADETYEFWFIGDGVPVNAGLFTEDTGTVEFDGILPGEPAVWAITVEPSGGSPAPTGEILYSVEV